MKLRSTTPVSAKGKLARMTLVAIAAIMVVTGPMAIYTATTVRARDYDAEISAIQSQIDVYEGQAKALGEQAKSLQNELALLAQQKQKIQAEIDLSQAKYEKLQQDIAETERKIQENQDLLGQIIADIYTDDTISPLEMLASAKDIGDYLDQQEYRSSISSSLDETIDRVKKLKVELEKQKVDTERVLLDQKNARTELAAKEQEQATILAQTQSDESAYKQMSADAQSQKRQIMEAQQAAIAAAIAAAAARSGGGGGLQISAGDGSKGGYPWEAGCWLDGNAWSYGGSDGRGGDPLGYGCRQCVSYTAWKMYQKTGYAPRYWGNANMWPNSARSAGFKTGSAPRANSLGVMYVGYYGHIVYVESYNQSTGMVYVSQYNYLNAGGPGWGHYSEMWMPASSLNEYIYL